MKFRIVSICCASLFAGLLGGALALAEAPSGQAQSQGQSFFSYVPREQDYPDKVRPVLEPLLRGIELTNAKKEREARRSFEKAVSVAEQLVKKLPRGYQDELFELSGLAHEMLKQPDKAQAAYARSLSGHANSPFVLFRQAYLMTKRGNCEKAVPKLKEVLWRTKENAHEVLYLTAECLLKEDKRDEALALATEGYKKNPHFMPLLRQIVAIREAQLNEEADPARRALLEGQVAGDLAVIVRDDPSDRATAITLSKFYLRTSDPLVHPQRLADAEALVQRLASQSNFSDEESVRLLVDTQIKRGKLDEAESSLKKGLSAKPDSATLKEAGRQLVLMRGLQG